MHTVVSTYTYPTTSNRLTKVTPTGGTARNFTYDVAGNTLTDSRTGALGLTSEYDVEGRLSKVYQTNNTAEGATYTYDARGRLSSRTVTYATAPTSTTTVYVHDLNDHIIAELNASGQTQREYIWLDDMPVAVVDNVASGNPVIYYVHVDHLMRPARMTAQDTSWVWDVIYAPFGGVSYIWSNPANIDLRFPGQWFQLESGLAYNWHRHYDATLGRYVQPDPLGLTAMLSDGPSVYTYAHSLPVVITDPTGLLVVSLDRLSRLRASVDQCEVADEGRIQPANWADGFEEMKCDQFISSFCRGQIRREFPSEFLDMSIGDLLKQRGDAADKARKLLREKRFRK